MTVSPELLQTHLAYNAWASARLLEAADKLPPEDLNRDHGTSDKSVLGTLVHVFAADRVWLRRIEGNAPLPFVTAGDHDLGVLRREWPQLNERWINWGGELTPQSLETRISYKDLRGNAWETPLWQVVLHVVNHATHHRGQAAGFLRSMGHTPPPLDLIAYYRSR